MTPMVVSSLTIAGITAVVGLLWKMSRDIAVLKTSMDGMERRFADHAKFIEMVLDRVLPERR